jgi:CRAL/TRIO domain
MIVEILILKSLARVICNNNIVFSTIENYLKFNQAFIEEALNMMQGNVDSYLVIIDCHNATRKNIPPSVIKESFKQFFQYYAARPYRTMIVNANFLVSSIFALIKPLLPKRTLERLRFIGRNQTEIRETFLKEMDIDTLPVRFGGNNALI